jgi:hypothetical protein
MATSPEEGMASMLRNLETSTGKSIETWIAIARSSGVNKHKLLVEHLKQEHSLTYGYANQIALRALAPDTAPATGSDDMIESQYTGPKAALRPLYDALVATIQSFGPDVEFSPKKAYVSVRRSKQFAILQPSTAQRLDIGINLKDVPAAGRLEESGSFNAMLSHRVRVSDLADINAELTDWLRQAYERA